MRAIDSNKLIESDVGIGAQNCRSCKSQTSTHSMNTIKLAFIVLFIIQLSAVVGCQKNDSPTPTPTPPTPTPTTPTTTGRDTVKYELSKFCMGADLSFVNQILDHKGYYKDGSPYQIFKKHGANLVRVRLWKNPAWTKTVYTPASSQMYSDLADVEKTIRLSKAQGLAVNLDIHYSDTWADPTNQNVPEAWKNITTVQTLSDSVYQYTYQTLKYLDSKGLMPEMVQVGNETNCGFMITKTASGFPDLNSCNSGTVNLGKVINAGIKAVRDVSATSSIKSEIILHVADPKNIEWWFTNIMQVGKVTDFDIIGISYYPLWHTTISFANLGTTISRIKSKFSRKVMIVETAYPWAAAGNDSYGDQFSTQVPVPDCPFTKDGQYKFMKDLTQAVITAGGSGIMSWEPAWITSQMKDPWGTGSSMENCSYFDFLGNTLETIDFMNYKYTFPTK